MKKPAVDAPKVTLKVGEALARDAGRGVVRLDPDVLAGLGARIGDAVEVTGGRKTAGRAMPTFPDQRGRGMVHMDGVTRLNAGTGLGERVEIRRVAAATAEQVGLTVADGGEARFPNQLLEGLVLMEGDRVRLNLFGARVREVVVTETRPAGPVVVGPRTRLRVTGQGQQASTDRGFSYEDLGGLAREIRRVREMVELPLRYPGIFERLGIDPPKGVLLSGPPGTGKTMIARAVASETRASFFLVSGPEVIHKFYGESEAKLREIFEAASRKAPSVIFLDEIDAIAPRRDRVQGDVEKRVVAQLLALMDGLKDRGQVIVIGATNLPDLLDPALRRPGRFDRELSIGVPDCTGRREILDIHTRGMPLAEDVSLDDLATKTPGFVGADLAALCREAAMATLRRILPESDLAHGLNEQAVAELKVDRGAFLSALTEMGPSTVRELVVEVPNVRWNQVGGLTATRDRLREALEWPMGFPELFRKAGCRPIRGILLAGPPGTGKTLLARAAATESGVNFLSVKGPELLSRYVGDSERAVREVFRKARQAAPCILFLDEVDSLAPTRGDGDAGVSARVVAQLLTEMDGIEELAGVLVLAATNRADLVDQALLRPGRFDLVVPIELPDAAGCEEVLRIHMEGKPLSAEIDLAGVARRSLGLSPAAIAGACEGAAMAAVGELIRAGRGKEPERLLILPRHLEEGLSQVRARQNGAGVTPSRVRGRS